MIFTGVHDWSRQNRKKNQSYLRGIPIGNNSIREDDIAIFFFCFIKALETVLYTDI